MDRESLTTFQSKIKTAAVFTLGCKVNSFESAAIKEQLQNADVTVVPFSSVADLYVINTCTVTMRTDAESRQMIRRAKRRNPKGIIAVTGCYAQLKADEIKNITGVDYVFGNALKGKIVDRILSADKRAASSGKIVTTDISKETRFDDMAVENLTNRNRAFLKIQDGCDSFCSYCIVPYARGSIRSLAPDEAVASIKRFVRAGFKEVVLSGIHIGKYGSDLTAEMNLLSLLKRIEKETALLRVRISSIEPNEITDGFIEFMRVSKKVCNHLHIPLQAADDDILKRMNRPYIAGDYSILIKKLKDNVKDIIIGADVITGFPGETDEQYLNTYNFISGTKIDYLHVFPFSGREGTPAFGMAGQINKAVIKERARKLRELGEQKRAAAYKNAVGQSVSVLFEKGLKKNDFVLHGIATNYLSAVIKRFDEEMYNTETECLVKDAGLYNNRVVIFL